MAPTASMLSVLYVGRRSPEGFVTTSASSISITSEEGKEVPKSEAIGQSLRRYMQAGFRFSPHKSSDYTEMSEAQKQFEKTVFLSGWSL